MILPLCLDTVGDDGAAGVRVALSPDGKTLAASVGRDIAIIDTASTTDKSFFDVINDVHAPEHVTGKCSISRNRTSFRFIVFFIDR